MEKRIIRVEALSRVEGEGGLTVTFGEDESVDVKLDIFEPPRLFESLLRGRPLEETPDITARICGICPIAYQMSSVHALERALGMEIPDEIRALRRLLYCGEWITSHSLHVHLLHAADYLGLASGLELAGQNPAAFARGMLMKQAGNRLLEWVGGRSVHPVNVCVGGFYSAPSLARRDEVVQDLERGLAAAVETVQWVAELPTHQFTREYRLVSLVHDHEYPMNEGDVAVGSQTRIGLADFETTFREFQVGHSTSMHACLDEDGTPYLTGPLARLAHNWERLFPRARALAGQLGIDSLTGNPFRSIVARAIEMVHAFEEGLEIARQFEGRAPVRISWAPQAGEGFAATEAPRGLLYHRYRVDSEGRIEKAVIIPPTSQNLAQIESDLKAWIPTARAPNDDSLTARRLEDLVRCFDPCISCATHFLKVKFLRTDQPDEAD